MEGARSQYAVALLLLFWFVFFIFSQDFLAFEAEGIYKAVKPPLCELEEP